MTFVMFGFYLASHFFVILIAKFHAKLKTEYRYDN